MKRIDELIPWLFFKGISSGGSSDGEPSGEAGVDRSNDHPSASDLADKNAS
jgi:hypothetical protein